MMHNETVTCPRCGAILRPEVHPRRAGRLYARCTCNQGRPVLEFDAGPGLRALPGVGEEIAAALVRQGLFTPVQVCAVADETLLELPGIGPGVLSRIRAFCNYEEEVES